MWAASTSPGTIRIPPPTPNSPARNPASSPTDGDRQPARRLDVRGSDVGRCWSASSLRAISGRSRRPSGRAPSPRAAASRGGRRPGRAGSGSGSGSPAAGRSGWGSRLGRTIRWRARWSGGSGIGTLDSSASVYGWQRRLVHRVGVGELDQLAGVEDRDAVRDVAHDGQVVGDEQVGDAELALEVLEQVDDLRPHRHVEGRRPVRRRR